MDERSRHKTIMLEWKEADVVQDAAISKAFLNRIWVS